MRWVVDLVHHVALLEHGVRDADKLIHEDGEVEILPARPLPPPLALAKPIQLGCLRSHARPGPPVGIEGARDGHLGRQAKLLVDALACVEGRAQKEEEGGLGARERESESERGHTSRPAVSTRRRARAGLATLGWAGGERLR